MITKFSMPYNGDPNIIDATLSDYRYHVSSFYGSLGLDLFGSGRALRVDQYSSFDALRTIISKLNQHSIYFNYIINSASMLNREFMPHWQASYREFLRQLYSCGTTMITLSNIYLIKWTKKHFDHFKISASVNLKPRTVQEVEFLVNLGCDEITLHYDVLKDIDTLSAIRNRFDRIDLKLIPNDIYIKGCPWQKGHTRMQAAHSRKKGFITPYFSYYRNKCVDLRQRNPEEIFKAMWIPPEQINRYEEIGYCHFKLLDRLASTPWNLRCLRAYVERKPISHMETILGTYGANHTSAMPEPISPDDPPYPTTKLEVIPCIASRQRIFTNKKTVCKPDCLDCEKCSVAAHENLIFSEELRSAAIRNNRDWRSKITKIDFINALANYCRRICYE